MNTRKRTRFFERKSVWAVIYALYITLILLSVHAFIAEETVSNIRDNMEQKYTYYLTFENDGVINHYDVTRHDTNEPAYITLTYWTQDNKLDITNVENIKTLKIDVQSMFEDEANKVFKKLPGDIPGMDLDYWLDANDGIFTIEFEIDSSEPMEELTFTKFPTPKTVLVNSQDWWQAGTNYVVNGNEITISDIPTGVNTVVIYFKATNQLPVPSIVSNPAQYAGVNEKIEFNGSASTDADGTITSWVWNFGDNNSDSGKSVIDHSYSKPGTYTVRLTVRDDASPYGEAWIEKKIIVAYGAEDDFDQDGLRDKWEWDNFGSTNPKPDEDPDSDGYVNALEQEAVSDPADGNSYKEDSDSDGLDDLWEWGYWESLDETAEGDSDSDDFTNEEEHKEGTDPTNPDDPGTGKGAESKEGEQPSNIIWIILIVVVVIILIPIFMHIQKSKKVQEKEDETITEMEAKIEKARKMGLPTREMEKLLREAKEGKGSGKSKSRDEIEFEPERRKGGSKSRSGPPRDRGRRR